MIDKTTGTHVKQGIMYGNCKNREQQSTRHASFSTYTSPTEPPHAQPPHTQPPHAPVCFSFFFFSFFLQRCRTFPPRQPGHHRLGRRPRPTQRHEHHERGGRHQRRLLGVGALARRVKVVVDEGDRDGAAHESRPPDDGHVARGEAHGGAAVVQEADWDDKGGSAEEQQQEEGEADPPDVLHLGDLVVCVKWSTHEARGQ